MGSESLYDGLQKFLAGACLVLEYLKTTGELLKSCARGRVYY